jgi:hypothetical protein
MFNKSFILPLVALFLASACGDDPVNLDLKKEDSSVRGRDAELASAKDKDRDGDQVAATGAFDRKLSGLVTRAAPWGDVEIRVEGARLQRGDKPANFPSHVVFTKRAVYAVLELQLEAKGESATDYRERNTWDLLLADGTRVSSLNPVGALLEPGDSQTVSLFYQVEDAANLRGAAVEINGSERDVLEPLSIPLDEERDFESQVELRHLVGESFDADDGQELSLEIVDAVYGVNLLSSGRRAPLDQRLVQLTVRASNTGASSLSFDAREDGPRISLDDDSIVAAEGQVEKIKSGATREFVMVYAIDEAVRQFDLVLDLDDEAGSCVSVELPPLAGDADADTASDGDSASDSEDAADSSDDSDSDDEVDSSDESDSEDEVDSSDDSDSGDEADSDDESSSEDGSNSDDDADDGAGDDFDRGVN